MTATCNTTAHTLRAVNLGRRPAADRLRTLALAMLAIVAGASPAPAQVQLRALPEERAAQASFDSGSPPERTSMQFGLDTAASDLSDKGPWATWAGKKQHWVPLVSIAVVGAADLLIKTPDTCRWCRDNGIDRAVRKAVRAEPEDVRSRAKLSDRLLWTSASLPLVALASASGNRRSASAMVTSAVAAGIVANVAAKKLVGRQRPFVHYNSPGGSPGTEPNGSFYSGHSSFTFAAATSALSACGLTACSAGKWLYLGLPLAATTAYLRLAADVHYASDVLAGAAAGSAVGWWMPKLFRSTVVQKTTTHVDIAPLVGSKSLGVSIQWPSRSARH